MDKTFALVEGPQGTKKMTAFVVIYDGESLEVLGKDASAIGAAAQIQKELDNLGASFTLQKALKGYTYYRREIGKCSKDKEKDFRRRFPVSSVGGYQKSADAVLHKASLIRSRALR